MKLFPELEDAHRQRMENESSESKEGVGDAREPMSALPEEGNALPDVSVAKENGKGSGRRKGLEPMRRIRVRQDNQKRKGSKSWFRYEKYKSARTIEEYYDLGGVAERPAA